MSELPIIPLSELAYTEIDWTRYNELEDEIIRNEYKRREKILIILSDKKNPENIATAKLLIQVWKNDPVAFILDCVFTYDPRRKHAKRIPFTLFPRQIEYIRFLQSCYENRDDGLIEKCRDVGLSWLNCGYSVWLYVFHSSISIGWGANKLELVDRLGDMNSLLERMDFVVRYLPKEIRPYHERRFTKLINHTTGSAIVGQGGSNAGRGGRSSIFFLDESAFIEGISKVEASLSMNTDCQIWLSTPNGMNLFYKKRMGGHFKVFTFHWYQDPRKDEAWFEKQKRKLDPTVFAQEVLIDYSGSIENQVIQSEWIDASLKIELEPSGAKFIGFDIADEGADKNATVARYGSSVKDLDIWSGKGSTISNSVSKVWNYAVNNGYGAINYDAFGMGAGAKSDFVTLRRNNTTVRIAIVPIKGKALSTGFYQGTDRKTKDTFKNERALIWWNLRMRFIKTYEHYNGLEVHDEDELISLKDVRDHEYIDNLISELVSPTYFMDENGKIQIESKDNMKKRGVQSPNIADALVYAFYSNGFNLAGLMKR